MVLKLEFRLTTTDILTLERLLNMRIIRNGGCDKLTVTLQVRFDIESFGTTTGMVSGAT